MTPVPRVSVVTPFHNTEAYLAQCIESVLAQSYQDYEYILVDNQSTDRSGAIAASYASRDSRIRLIRSEYLRPQVPNYNFALEQIAAVSSYCKLVQADDWLFPRCLEEMIALADANPSVAVVSSYRMVERELSGTDLSPDQTVLTGREACRSFLLGGPFLFGSPTTVLYRSDLVRSRRPFFALDRLHEDTEAVYEILANRDFGFVHQILSFSRRTADSMTASVQSFAPNLLDRLILLKRFGAHYLEPVELKSTMAEVLDGYYRALAVQWLRDRIRSSNRAFWDYHRKGLESVGESVRPHLLAAGMVTTFLGTGVSAARLVKLVKGAAVTLSRRA